MMTMMMMMMTFIAATGTVSHYCDTDDDDDDDEFEDDIDDDDDDGDDDENEFEDDIGDDDRDDDDVYLFAYKGATQTSGDIIIKVIDDDIYAIGEKYLIEDLKALRANLLTQTKQLLSQQPLASQVPSKHLMTACMTLFNSLGHASSSAAAMWLLQMQSLSTNKWLRDVWMNYSLNPWSNLAYSMSKLDDLHTRNWPYAKRMVQVTYCSSFTQPSM